VFGYFEIIDLFILWSIIDEIKHIIIAPMMRELSFWETPTIKSPMFITKKNI